MDREHSYFILLLAFILISMYYICICNGTVCFILSLWLVIQHTKSCQNNVVTPFLFPCKPGLSPFSYFLTVLVYVSYIIGLSFGGRGRGDGLHLKKYVKYSTILISTLLISGTALLHSECTLEEWLNSTDFVLGKHACRRVCDGRHIVCRISHIQIMWYFWRWMFEKFISGLSFNTINSRSLHLKPLHVGYRNIATP